MSYLPIGMPTRSTVITKKSGDPRFMLRYARKRTNLMSRSEQYHAGWADEIRVILLLRPPTVDKVLAEVKFDSP